MHNTRRRRRREEERRLVREGEEAQEKGCFMIVDLSFDFYMCMLLLLLPRFIELHFDSLYFA